MKNEQGYMTFVPGDRHVVFPGWNNTVLRTKGKLYTGTQPSLTIPANQFLLVGNPYASRIDMRKINSTGNAFYIWDPSIGGAYGLGGWITFSKVGNDYQNFFPSNIYGPAFTTNNFIESGMAFIVRRGDANPGTVQLEENDKEYIDAIASWWVNPYLAELPLHLLTSL